MTINWESYLKSIEDTYAQWWTCYTITDVVGKTRQRQPQRNENPPLLMGLTVRTVSEERELKEKIEQFPVVEGLRKYAPEQVLLIGRPGSGKSTALLRLLLEETRKPPVERLARIPVLVELRYYQTDFLDLIRDFCKRHGTLLTREDVERLLFEKQLFLLVDGLNELPSEAARRDVMAFRQTYPTTPMIFTTRDLGVGGDLNIAKKLTMQPLTEPQMQEFVRGYLGDGRMLAQLGPRLREFGQTPLLLWMLCSVFAENENHIPANLGSVFRCFCELYAHQLKQDVPAAEESPEWWQPMLQQLAWVMTRGESATEIQVAISRQKAEAVLAEFLAGKVAHPADCARRWLKDLLKYHLLQLGTGNQIEFRHQLIQEYYAAESLLQRLPSLGRDELKWEYLNYLKWTEPLALMLELVEEEALAVQVVQWGLEMDWALGARLAGAVQPQWQEQTVGLVSGLNLPQFYIVELLGKIGSEAAIPPLVKALEHSNSDVRSSAVSALAQIGSEAAIPGLLQALEHSDSDVRSSAANALGQISSEAAIPGLLQALKDFYWTVRHSAANALGQIGSEAAIPGLLQALEHSDSDVRSSAANALGQIGSEAAIPGLLQALEHSDSDVRSSAANALGQIGSEAAIPGLLQALKDFYWTVRHSAANALGQIGSEAAIPGLLQALEHSDSDVRSSAANALGQIGSEAAIPGLLQALKDFYWTVRHSAANALGQIGSEAAIPGLLQALEHSDSDVRSSAVFALGQIGSEAAIPGLLQALKDSDWDVRRSVASALAQIGSEAAIPGLTQALEDPNLYVRRSVASALGQIGLETAIPGLTQALEDPNLYVRRIAVSVLAQIGSEAAIPGLLQALKDSDWDVRRSVASALAQIGSEAAIPGLTQALADPNLYVRRSAADSLGQIGLEAAIPGLIQALEDREFYVRRNSAFALGEIGSKAATFGLIQALEDREFYIRINAAFALGKIGSKAAIPGLIQALKDSKMSVRISATHILSEMDSDAAIPGLIQALKDPKTSVRRSAADGLGKIGSEAAIPGLLQALKDDDWTVRRRAVNALGKMESKVAISGLNKALKHSYSYVRWSAANALVKIGSKAAYFCLKSALKDSALYVRSSAAFALGEMGLEVAIPDLIQTLKSPASYVRLSATDALGKIGAEAAIPGLMQALKDSDSYIRSSATDALGKIGSEAAIPGLMQALKDSDSYIRNNAAFALNRMGLDAAIPGLMQALEDSSLYIRKNAAYVLGEMGLDSATLGLIQALEDSSLDVRRSASSALVKISSERVLFELRQHLKKPDVVQFNNGDTFRNAIRTLKTVQKKPKYYQPLPKYMMSNSLSHHYALLIGIGNCKDPKCSLPVTVKDIQALQSLLTDANRCGYINDTEHLRSLHDSAATKEGILNGLNWLKQQTANDPEATVIIYYSGHGWLDNTTKKYYLIPHDVKPHKISSSALSADTFNQALQKIQAQKVLVIIDSCHAQGMADAKDEPLEMPDGFAATALPKSLADTLSQGEGRAVFTSSKGNQQSWIRPDNSLSIFTDHFLQALQGAGNRPGDKAVMVSDLMNYVGKAVPESAQTDYQAEQIPFFKFETEDFPVALLRGGKGLPQEGWEGVKAQAEEKIQKIGGDVSNTVTGNVGNVVNINAEKVQVGDISSGKG